jgi:hypothetical protein
MTSPHFFFISPLMTEDLALYLNNLEFPLPNDFAPCLIEIGLLVWRRFFGRVAQSASGL